ncbi:hypothetical protein SAMN05421664_3533 [Chryseobacterium soldanellicola]|uniref:Uncharacterized protein n=1 Tax=Chryseobacterium soldanellicola TaxID=311333 RepID=A0A1H1GA52_9FLAO|nr:hypothetical protein SAMN05421664_3533 [Chryseobacterium soldanellicola]
MNKIKTILKFKRDFLCFIYPKTYYKSARGFHTSPKSSY